MASLRDFENQQAAFPLRTLVLTRDFGGQMYPDMPHSRGQDPKYGPRPRAGGGGDDAEDDQDYDP